MKRKYVEPYSKLKVEIDNEIEYLEIKDKDGSVIYWEDGFDTNTDMKLYVRNMCIAIKAGMDFQSKKISAQ